MANCASTRLILSLCIVTFGGSSSLASNGATPNEPKEAQPKRLAGNVDRGFVFLRGEYIAPPYILEWSREAVLINGEAIPATAFTGRTTEHEPSYERELEAGRHNRRPSRDAIGNGRRRALSGVPWFRNQFVENNRQRSQKTRTNGAASHLEGHAFALLDCLVGDGLLVFFENEPLLQLADTAQIDAFLNFTCPQQEPPAYIDGRTFESLIPAKSGIDQWTAIIGRFNENDLLSTRVGQRFAATNRLLLETEARHDAVTRLDNLAYPLTVIGMLLAIGGFGHLLRSVPQGDEAYAANTSERLQRATGAAVLLIAAFAGLDLVWTILTAQAGTMRELNPLAGQLIDNPVLLSAFKVGATAIGCGLLYSLRSNRRAADAAWWMCLVMTFVTFRWIMFNSMFV